MRCAVRELLDLDVTGVCVCVQATLKALLGGKHLSMAERAILAQLLPEEQAGLLQQLADSKKGVAAERIADPCGWLAATASRIHKEQLASAWQLSPPHAAAAMKLPAAVPTARPSAADEHRTTLAVAAPAARGPSSPAAPRPEDALLEARTAALRATPRCPFSGCRSGCRTAAQEGSERRPHHRQDSEPRAASHEDCSRQASSSRKG